ncbi:MAG: SPOR domain-containing protein, partial [bacterium]
LNNSVLKINSVWIEAVQSTNNGILINGKSLKRGDVPRLSEELGGVKITKLVRSESGGARSYAFTMEVNWHQPPSPFTLPKSFELEKPPFLKTASTETPSQNSKTSDWGTTTIVTQTVIAEEDVGQKQQDNTAISNVQSKSSLAFNDKNQLDQFSKTETSSAEPSVKNKFEYGKKTKIENNRSPDVSSRENYASQEKDEPRSNNNSRFTIKISAHANKFTAKKEVEFYRSRGFDTYITTLPNSSREIPYWVCLGDFASYDEAQKELIRLNRVIPGRRVVVKISENGAVNQVSSPLSLQTEQKISPDSNKPDSRLIKKANHTELSYPNDVVDNQQNLINSDSEYFTVRISAHVTKFTANKDVKLFRSKGYDTYITQLPNSSKEVPYSVCLGYFNNYAEAENKIKELMKRIPRNYDVRLVNK